MRTKSLRRRSCIRSAPRQADSQFSGPGFPLARGTSGESFALNRHPHRGAQAPNRTVGQRDIAAMRARDVPRDGETEAGVALVLIARIVEPHERPEHFL